jgi:hypothetical protein
MNIHIIGCGGVGSYFLPPFLRTLKHTSNRRFRKAHVTLHDGDKLEERNLQRQNFNSDSVFAYKADALKQELSWYPRLSASVVYIDSSFQVQGGDLVIVFADNHLARHHALAACDRDRADCISAANSTVGAEAWFYEPRWRGTGLDPRVRHPEIDTDTSFSPLQADGCQSEERLEDIPQTPIANFMAASHALLLWNFHYLERPNLDEEMTRAVWPISFSSTGTRNQTHTHHDYSN